MVDKNWQAEIRLHPLRIANLAQAIAWFVGRADAMIFPDMEPSARAQGGPLGRL